MNILFKIKSLFVIITISFLFGFSCKKEPQEFDLSPEIKALWDFKPGTYWIYQDSISGETDSVYVFNYNQRYDYYRGNGSGENFTGKSANFEFITSSFILFGDTLRSALSFKDVYFNLDEEFTQSYLDTGFIAYIKNIGETSPNYLHCNTPNQSSLSYYSLSPLKVYCVKPNIGVTRYEFKDGRVYKLIRQRVVQ